MSQTERVWSPTGSADPPGRDALLPVATDIGQLLDPDQLVPEYQPVYDLSTREQIGAEALARWPALRIMPEEAFRWATQAGRLAELDEACRNAAIAGAVDRYLPPGFELFVNLEPSVLGPDTATRLLAHTAGRVGLMIEITERSLTDRPAELLRALAQLREAGCGIALDDVGAMPGSLALLPFIAPDVIKLDISLVQRWPDVERAAIYTTVAAHAERSGATILAEGIESERHMRLALALGATLGQGWYLGRAGPLQAVPEPSRPLGLHRHRDVTPIRPFDLVDPGAVRIGSKDLLLGMSLHLEHQGLALELPPVVLTALENFRHFPRSTARRYERLAERCPLVAVLGLPSIGAEATGVRMVALEADDPLRDDWVVTVVGGHYAGALIARDLGDHGPDLDRRFAFVLTHHHGTVLAAARSLLGRVTASGTVPAP